MMGPTVFRVVDSAGQEHGRNMTSEQATAMMQLLLAARPNVSMRSERMDAAIASKASADVPPMVAAAAAEAAVTTALKAIEAGREREALREAIESHLDALARLDAANQAVERAAAFVAARQSELDAITAAHQSEIEAGGAGLAAALKAGDASFEARRVIDRGPVLDAGVRLDTAKAAIEQLVAEQKAADVGYKAAETAVRLAVMAVKRSDVAAMVRRLQDVKVEYMALSAAIDGARFSDVPTTQAAREAIQIEAPHAGLIDAAAQVWGRYSAALRDDPDALREDFA
jgi:hypothetical protein